MRRAHTTFRRGFTLVESMIACAVLAVMVVALAGSLAASHQQSGEVNRAARSVQLARSLMEEIAARPFSAAALGNRPGFSAGNSDRSTYDEILDYDGYTDASPFRPLDPDSPAVDFAPGFSRAVAVKLLSTPTTTASNVAQANFAVVTVVVTGPNGETWPLTRWVSRSTLVR